MASVLEVGGISKEGLQDRVLADHQETIERLLQRVSDLEDFIDSHMQEEHRV